MLPKEIFNLSDGKEVINELNTDRSHTVMNDKDLEKQFWRASKRDVPCARIAVEKILGCEVTAEQTINYALKFLEDNYREELEKGRVDYGF